jgi:hypothetical protein
MTSSTAEDQSWRSAAGLITGSAPRIPGDYPLADELTLPSICGLASRRDVASDDAD